MAQLTVCDRCKQPTNNNLDDRRTATYGVAVTFREKDPKGEKAERFDLCAPCCAATRKFMRGE